MNQLNLSLRPHHRQLLDFIRHHAPVTRAELSRITGLTPGAITQQCRELIFSGLIVEGDRITGHRGQPSLPISLNPEGAFALGVAFGDDHIDFTAVDLAGNVLFVESEKHELNQSLTSAIEQLKGLIPNTLNNKQIDMNRILGIGIGLPGYMQKDGMCRPTVDWLSDWSNTNLFEQFSKALQMPLWIEHNANTAAIGEYYSGNWKQIKNMVILDFSYGLNAGIIIEGKLLRGAFGNAGEISESKKLSQPSLVELFVKENLDYSDANKLVESQHSIIESWIATNYQTIEQYILDAIHWLDPELVVLTGTLPKALLERIALLLNEDITNHMAQNTFGRFRAKIVSTQTGIENIALGAALLPLYQTLSIN